MLNKLVGFIILFLLFNIAALGQDEHSDVALHYLSCDQSVPGLQDDDGRLVNRRWKATWNGNGFHHIRGNGETEGVDHDDTVMNYLTFDGGCWQTEWNPSKGIFMQRPYPNGAFTEGVNRIDYLTWDRSKWHAKRDGDGWIHTFAGSPDDTKKNPSWLAKKLEMIGKGIRGIHAELPGVTPVGTTPPAPPPDGDLGCNGYIYTFNYVKNTSGTANIQFWYGTKDQGKNGKVVTVTSPLSAITLAEGFQKAAASAGIRSKLLPGGPLLSPSVKVCGNNYFEIDRAVDIDTRPF